MRIYHSERGPGLWRFNNMLLQNQTFVHAVREEIKKAITGADIYADVNSKGLTLEMLSSQIRVISIKMSKKLARQSRENEEAALRALRNCESELARNPSEQRASEYSVAKSTVDNLQEAKGKRAIIRSGARWIEQGEKPSKYFLNLCAKRE